MNPYCPHLKFMYNCSFFTPPASGVITPKQVLPCAEWVEVITDGVVFFEWEGKLREFRKGTIFWHKAGDWTVWQTTREEPYSCGVFLFAYKTAAWQGAEGEIFLSPPRRRGNASKAPVPQARSSRD